MQRGIGKMMIRFLIDDVLYKVTYEYWSALGEKSTQNDSELD